MNIEISHRTVATNYIEEITAALAGAFAEGFDLGPRGAQIRAIGRELEIAIDALRLKLVSIYNQGPTQLDLNQLMTIARAARAYRTSDHLYSEQM